MQPAFPPDHHFHERRGSSGQPVHPSGGRSSAEDAASEQVGRALEYFARQCMPALDPSDPRAQG
ncbi:MAG TPA: hypothetical protein VEQ61_07090 [Thermoleophilaceae bacterium]|nr:hypothetical protein [Thermoleophilaceae bacterium]